MLNLISFSFLIIPEKGSRQGELAVVTRGTATGHDWLSNFNVTTTRGPSGYIVHAGFQQVFKSIEESINIALKSKNPSRIHCIGHSLGGAVSNLVASKLSSEGHGVSLYTFGAPRVGMNGMTQHLASRLGENNIYRVYNPADVVPMIPIYPFMHAPSSSDGLCVKTGGDLFSLNAHFMSAYTPAVEQRNWKSLGLSTSAIPLNVSVDQWIDKADDYVKMPGSSIAMWALGHALKGLLDLAQTVGAVSYIVGSTVADQISSVLLKAAHLSKAIGERIVHWISLVLRYAGKTINVSQNITQVFLRWVLDMLMMPLLFLARRAIDGVNRM